ncbi:MAG: cobalamin B12-binding domain-containing protein, partial [Ignavibacteria bacterium]|nr:cobalamin B12-binding domain-containing protein [Ignavibacteria bacterium]
MRKRILCVPFDPVHDVGIKIIRNELAQRGYETELLPPDLSPEQIVKIAANGNYDFILVSRTIGYGVAELLARFIDMLDAAGVRKKSKIVIGGKPITPELAAELGFDKGFGEHSSIEELIAYIEGKEITVTEKGLNRTKPDFISKYSYNFFDQQIEDLLEIISEKLLKFISNKTSPGVERAKIREEILQIDNNQKHNDLKEKYLSLCDEEIVNSIKSKKLVKNVREISVDELQQLDEFLRTKIALNPKTIQHNNLHPLIFKFLGSGCPIMDLIHGKICERYGINGFLIINPSWEARYEGLLEGYLTHENDGTITSFENIKLIKNNLDKSTLLSVRAHRGLNLSLIHI